jgi:hypothetical protein
LKYRFHPGLRLALVHLLKEHVQKRVTGWRAIAAAKGLLLGSLQPESQVHLARTCFAMTRAAGLMDAPAEIALPFSQEIADEAGLRLSEAGDYLLSQEGQARLAGLKPVDPEWLPLLRRLLAEVPGPTAREPFMTRMAELIGVWHDVTQQRGGRVVFDAELAFELGLLGDHGTEATRSAEPAVPEGATAIRSGEGWAEGAYLSTDQLTPLRPRTIEFMPKGFRDPSDAYPWVVRLGWVTSPEADIERTESFGVTSGLVWGHAIERT